MSSTTVKPPDEHLPGRIDSGQGTPPIDTSKLSEQDRKWVLTAYNERTEATRKAEELQQRLQASEQERARLDGEVKTREAMIARLATPREPDQDGRRPNDRGIVSRDVTQPIDQPKTRRIEFDPWDPNVQEKLATEVERIAEEVSERTRRAMAEWYQEDRKTLWHSATQQDSLGVLYAVEWAELRAQNPDLSIGEFSKLIEAAPRYNYSLRATYDALHPEVRENQMREKIRVEERKKIEEEWQKKFGAAPPLNGGAPPVMGGPTAHPRAKGGERPTTYAEATRMAYQESGHKLIE